MEDKHEHNSTAYHYTTTWHPSTLDSEPPKTEWEGEVYVPRAPGETSDTDEPWAQVNVMTLISRRAGRQTETSRYILFSADFLTLSQ